MAMELSVRPCCSQVFLLLLFWVGGQRTYYFTLYITNGGFNQPVPTETILSYGEERPSESIFKINLEHSSVSWHQNRHRQGGLGRYHAGS